MNEGNRGNKWMSRTGEAGWVRHSAPIPALMPMSSRPSMIISKEPALRLEPNRIAAATTKMLFTRRDFFLGGNGTRQEGSGQSRGTIHGDTSLQLQPALIRPVCVNCVKEPKQHEWIWPVAIVHGFTRGMHWKTYSHSPLPTYPKSFSFLPVPQLEMTELIFYGFIPED